MSATASNLAQRAHTAVERLSAAIDAGNSAAHLQLICSELFEALRLELESEAEDVARRDMLLVARDLCQCSADTTLSGSLRVAQLRAVVTLLQGGLTHRPIVGVARFRVIQGGVA